MMKFKGQELWLGFAQIAVWLLGLVAPFVAEPPALSPSAGSDSWAPLAQFLVTFGIGLFWIGARRLRLRVWVLSLLAVSSVVGGLVALSDYRAKSLNWSCEYARRGRLVVGWSMLPDAAAYSRRERSTCAELIEDSGGKTETIWPRDQLIFRHERLGWFYTLTVVLLASAAFLVLEAIRQPRRRSGGKTKRPGLDAR